MVSRNTTVATEREEKDNRIKMFDSFLQTPHRSVETYFPIHKELLEKDPEFYGRLSAWYMENGDVRDHKEVFTAMLISSNYPGHREAGLYYLRNLDPYQVFKICLPLAPKLREASKGRPAVKAKLPDGYYVKHVSKSFPGSMIKELTYYCWERERDRRHIDGVILRNRHDLKRILEFHRIPHSDYVNSVLFKDNPPPGSVFDGLKKISKEENPTVQAKWLMENKIPLQIAAGLLKAMTPAAWVALIKNMSPQEVINSLNMIKKKGAYDNSDIKKLVEEKLIEAKTNKRVSALKTKDAVKSANLSEVDSQLLNDIADKQIKSKGRIKQSTALLVDKSSSLDQAIEVAKQLGSMISTCMADETPLYTIAFDSMPRQITVTGKTFADWEAAFRHIHADGSTSVGAGVAWLTRNKIRVEQIVIITDEKENANPFFVKAYQEYVKVMGEEPHVIIVRVSNFKTYVTDECKKVNIPVDVYEVGAASDKYSFTNLIPMLARRSKLDLLMDVMSTELPKRPAPVPMPDVVRNRSVANA